METTVGNPSKSKSPLRLGRLLAAVLTGAVIGASAGALQQSGWALVVIQSLAGGAMLAVVLFGAFASLRLGTPRWKAAMLASMCAVVAQHMWLYRAVLTSREKSVRKQPATELFRPGWSQESMVHYFWSQATPGNVSLWLLDACLLTLAAVVIVEWARRTGEQESKGERGP